jgi:Holliday junction DNA helicase RuvA
MIALLTGKIESVGGESCVIDVNGVGYRVLMPLSALEALSREPGATVKVYTHFHLREDGASLFGFLNLDDKATFENIIGVSGIGPKTALAVLGTLSGEQFREAILNEDHRVLTGVSGVGLKTAQRLIFELQGKLLRGMAGEPGAKGRTMAHSTMGDAVDALISLGYPAREAVTAVETVHLAEPGLTTPELVRRALKNLGRK